MSVGENIKKMREKRNIKQSELAERTGVTQAMICQMERGTRNPSLQLGLEIAKVLDCTVDELLNG